MKTVSRILATLLFSLLLLSTAHAQTPRDTELPIDTLVPAKRPSTTASPVIVSATANSRRVRYASLGEVHQTRLQVFSADGTQVFDSDFRLGNLIDWPLADQQGQHLPDGSYLFLVTARDFSNNLTQKYATLQLEQEQVYLQQATRDELSSGQAAALASNQQAETVSTVDRIGAAGGNQPASTASDGGAVIDIAPSGKKASTSQPVTSGENISGAGTQNKIAKWIDNAGTLGDSNIFGDASGNVGIGTPTPGGQLHIFGAAGQDVFAGMGPDVINGPAMNYGYAGSSFGRGAGFFNVRPDASAVAPNPSLRFATSNVQRMIITNTGNVGIGTLSPLSKFDVAGDINTSTQYNIRGERVFGVIGDFEDFPNTNTFAGVGAGNSLTTSNFGNSFFGWTAGYSNTDGNSNSFFGTNAGYYNTTGFSNTLIGTGAGSRNTTGVQNTLIGNSAGFNNMTGIQNTIIGYSADLGAMDLSNATAIGANAIVSQSNSLVLGKNVNVGIGTSSPTTATGGRVLHIEGASSALKLVATNTGGQNWEWQSTVINNIGAMNLSNITTSANPLTVFANGNVGFSTLSPDQTLTVNGNASKLGGGSWLIFSDERLKTISGRFTPGLRALMQLQPIRYQYKPDNALGLVSSGEHIGFGAQAVQKIIPEAVSKNDRGYLLVNNDPIIWTMLNAIKEQQALIRRLQTRLVKVEQGAGKKRTAKRL
jgi:hypothetical protein